MIMPFSAVGEEDEVSIREAAEAIAEAMDFTGELLVSFTPGWPPSLLKGLLQHGGRGGTPTFHQQL